MILIAPGCEKPGPEASAAPEIIEKYLMASTAQRQNLRGVTMQVDIEAALPSLKKQGRLQALRHVSKLGAITYNAIRFVGDNTVKNDVISRYLTAETKVQNDADALAITPANYRFKYKGLAQRDNREVYVYQVTPIKKRVGLFKGEVWLDANTYLPVRESGRFVRNPSMFLKHVDFVRIYEIRDGVALPKRIESRIETRLVGRADLNINFSNFGWDEPRIAASGMELQ